MVMILRSGDQTQSRILDARADNHRYCKSTIIYLLSMG
jgi:hypothetical protein